jgi:pilus assembly protein CpaC
MQKLVIALALLSAVNRGLGQQYTPVPAESVRPRAVSLPNPAEHFEAAAPTDEARKMRAQADNAQPQVILRVRVFEISRTKLQNLGFDFSRVSSGPVQAESLVKVLDVLREVGVASVVSEPNLMTLNNRPASVRVGGHARVAVGLEGGRTGIEDKFYGMSLDFTPVVSDGHTIHLKLHFEKSCPDPTHCITVGGETAPMLDSLVLDTEGDYKSGKMVVQQGLVCSRGDSPNQAAADGTLGSASKAGATPQARRAGDVIETLFFITPEIVAPTTSKTAAILQTHR